MADEERALIENRASQAGRTTAACSETSGCVATLEAGSVEVAQREVFDRQVARARDMEEAEGLRAAAGDRDAVRSLRATDRDRSVDGESGRAELAVFGAGVEHRQIRGRIAASI